MRLDYQILLKSPTPQPYWLDPPCVQMVYADNKDGYLPRFGTWKLADLSK